MSDSDSNEKLVDVDIEKEIFDTFQERFKDSKRLEEVYPEFAKHISENILDLF